MVFVRKYLQTLFRFSNRIIENILSLTAVNIIIYIFPVIVIPYVVRIIGVEKYGLLAFAQSIIQYFIVISEYSFAFSAPRSIALNKENNFLLSQTFFSILFIRTFLMLICFVVLILSILTFDKLKSNPQIYLFTFSLVFVNAFNPLWFFQGIEKIKEFALITLAGKAVYAVSIFIIIKDRSDYIYVPLLNSLGTILIVVVSFIVIFKRYKLNIVFPKSKSLIKEIREGGHIFGGMISGNLYNNSSIFILGSFADNRMVGYYKGADLIIRSIISLSTSVSSAIYPSLCRLAYNDFMKYKNLIKRIILIFFILSLFVSILIFLFSDLIVLRFLGVDFARSAILLKVFAPLFCISALSNVIGVNGLLANNKNPLFSKAIFLGGVLNLSFAFILTPYFNDIGVSISALLAESIGLFILFFYFYKCIWLRCENENV